MPLVNSRFHQLSWEFLLTCLHVVIHGGRLGEGERRIIVASPWISDLENPNFRLRSPLLDGIETNSRRRLSNLGKVLSLLSLHGYDVIVVTSAPGSNRWKGNWNEESITRDRRFQEKLRSAGIEIIHNEDNHSKSISTPVGVLSGSANITDNGFFHNIEHMEVTDGTHVDFQQARDIIDQLTRGH